MCWWNPNQPSTCPALARYLKVLEVSDFKLLNDLQTLGPLPFWAF
jgi:hypothetical protein